MAEQRGNWIKRIGLLQEEMNKNRKLLKQSLKTIATDKNMKNF